MLVFGYIFTLISGYKALPNCPVESALNIPSGSITVNSNTGWVIGGWGFASPFNAKNYGDKQFNWGSGNFGFGNFGDDNQGNSNYGDGNLGNENFGSYNVGQGNCGSYNVGKGNTGTWNVGVGNSGSYNLGKGNNGTGNTGNVNNGQINVGALNDGQNNLGFSNLGDSNFGISNNGEGNVGWSNEGDTNIGASNVGDGNAGVSNEGSFNLGYLNSGSNNTGAWNYGQGNVGYLAGVQSAQISGLPSIYWKNVQINQLDLSTASDNTGWVNINDTNVGIGQSGYRNIGYLNVGDSNIGYEISGTENTGGNLVGDGLIGFDLSSPDGSDFTPVTIQGVPDENLLLDSAVRGFIQDSVISPYPQVFSQAQAEVQSEVFKDFRLTSCPTFTPVPISNSFSISVRCTGSVKITDLYCSGDAFNVYKDGKLWMTTPLVPVSNDPKCVNPQVDPEEAFYNPEFSHVLGWVPSGSYKITVVPTVTPWGGGAVAIKVDEFCERTALGSYIRY